MAVGYEVKNSERFRCRIRRVPSLPRKRRIKRNQELLLEVHGCRLETQCDLPGRSFLICFGHVPWSSEEEGLDLSILCREGCDLC